MSALEGGARNKKRITEQQVATMRKLHAEGATIAEIARTMKIHRHTASSYLTSRHLDIVGDQVKEKLLGAQFQNHFGQLTEFVLSDIRKQINASTPGEVAKIGKLSTAGVLGFPYTATGFPHKITGEWSRMYNPQPRDQHLLISLREHTRGSKLWVYWDRWHKKVAPFEKNSRALWEWLGVKLEEDPPEDIREIETVRSWVFGNMLVMAGGREPAGVETLTQGAQSGEFKPVVYSNLSRIQLYARKALDEAMVWPGLDSLKSAMADLADAKSHSELKRLAGEIDFALAGIELMSGFPGKCHLCPV